MEMIYGGMQLDWGQRFSFTAFHEKVAAPTMKEEFSSFSLSEVGPSRVFDAQKSH